MTIKLFHETSAYMDDDLTPETPPPTWLEEDDVVANSDPFQRFREWFAEAEKSEINDPNAMAIATVDETGLPNVRMVLLKGFDERGFVFYTNYDSVKGREILSAGKAALVFHWKSLNRQVRARGPIEKVADDEADAYYQSRARTSRIGAWASQQSRPLESRMHFEKEIARYTAKFGVGQVPRPPHWSGIRVIPQEIEFWQDRKFRLHDRVRFTRDQNTGSWSTARLFP
ncbi:MAG: pyridoxamine 5'-phosphate oxidase [Pseudomonadota bacterium]